MAKVDFQPQRPHELLAVYADEQTAQRVLIDLRDKQHETTASRGDKYDEQDALRAEMAEETTKSAIAPPLGALPTKESAKTASAIVPISIVVGLVIAMPIAFLFPADFSSGGRLAAGLFIGLIFGLMVGLVLTSLGQKRPNEPMAAEAGITVRVKNDRPELRKLMLDAHPLRLDVVDDQGRPIENLMSEGDSASPREIGKRVNEWP